MQEVVRIFGKVFGNKEKASDNGCTRQVGLPGTRVLLLRDYSGLGDLQAFFLLRVYTVFTCASRRTSGRCAPQVQARESTPAHTQVSL